MSQPPPLKNPKIAASIQLDPDPDPPPAKSASSDFLWSSLFADSAPSPSSSPSYLSNGTPVVIAPSSVILSASTTWSGHLLCRFLGEPPSPAKFYSDLNRIWGKFGNISVRRFSSGIFLVHVPSQSTRRWILQTGLWSSGTVSFVVSEWSVTSSLAPPPKLTSATTVLTIRDIPPQLWSHEGVTTIAGGVARLIPGIRASLPMSSLGTATIRVIVPLGSPLPHSVLVKDSRGDSVLVSIDYGSLPHLCVICQSYGHQSHRCPSRKSASEPIPSKEKSKVLKTVGSESMLEVNPTPKSQVGAITIDSSNLSAAKTLLNASAPADQSMEIDVTTQSAVTELIPEHIDSIMVSKRAPELVIQPKEIDTTIREVSGSACSMDQSSANKSLLRLSGEPNQTALTSIQDVFQPIQAHVQDQEGSTQPAESDSFAGNDLISKCSSDSIPISNTSPLLRSTHQLLQSSPKVDILPETVPSSSEIPQTIAEPMEEEKQPISITAPPSNQSTFSFPPSDTHALEPPSMSSPMLPPPIQNPQLSEQAIDLEDMVSQAMVSKCVAETSTALDSPPSSLLDTSSKTKKMANKDKRQTKIATSSSLTCKTESHKFKPKGIVEKRRKKTQNELILEDEDFTPSFQEMEFDKKQTTHYEAIYAHKILRKIYSTEKELPQT